MNTKAEIYDEDDVIDLRQILAIVWNKRWWVIVSVVLSTCVFATAAFVMTPVYSASVVLIPANSVRSSSGALSSALGQLGGLASFAGINVGSGDSDTTEALAILRSRNFLEQFINDQKLMPELFANKWDSVNAKWKVSEESRPTVAKAYKYFIKNVLTVSQDKKTSLITFQIEWKDREKAASFANELVKRINAEMRARAIVSSDASIGYLEQELKSTNMVATQEAINRLIESQIKQRMLANVTPEYAFRVVDKAIAPDPDDIVRPKRVSLILGGAVFGCVFPIVWLLIARSLSLNSAFR